MTRRDDCNKQPEITPEDGLAAIMIDASNYSFLPEQLQSDPTICEAAIAQGFMQIGEIDHNYLISHFPSVKKVILARAFSLKGTPEIYRNDRELMLAAIRQDTWQIRYLPKHLRADKEIAMQILSTKDWPLKGIPLARAIDESLWDDKDVMLLALAQNRRAWGYLSDRLKADPDFAQYCPGPEDLQFPMW